MDNTNQAVGSLFNLKAYGLANRLLQNNIPLLWVVKSGKAKDAVDFTAAAARYKPSVVASATVNFAGGPFIVHPNYTAAATPIIDAFGNNVAVFKLTNDTIVDVRYTLTHKPLVAVGLKNSKIHTDLLDFAMIPNYVAVSDETVNATTCVTLVTQPHTTDAVAVFNIKEFVMSGGNYLAQCAAVNTYENIVPLGQYQTNIGYDIMNVETVFTYPNADMPFAQFLGALEPAPGGAEQDWQLRSGSSFINNTFIIAQNSGTHTNKYAATVSKLYNAGYGGVTMYLGGHDYGQGGNDLGLINGQRMYLNAVFQPPTRPEACGITLGFPLLEGWKSVKLTNNVWPYNMGPGDTLTWRVVYHNNGSLGTSNVQINDVLSTFVTLSGSPTIAVFGTGTSASLNPSWNGRSVTDMLAPGATIGVQGTVLIEIPTTINAGVTEAIIENWPIATGLNIPPEGVHTDAIDSSTLYPPVDVPQPLIGSVPQIHTAHLDPTVAAIFVPTAASLSIDGMVRTADGQGISRALITVTNPSNGDVRTVLTNPFGYYTVSDLPAGEFYIVTVSHKKYQFPTPSFSFVLNDNVAGLVFVAAGDNTNIAKPDQNKEVTIIDTRQTGRKPRW